MAFCKVSKKFRNVGITVMDGEYFSVMPFGHDKLHTLTSVEHTPHFTSFKKLHDFSDQSHRAVCGLHGSQGCFCLSENLASAWKTMYKLSQKFLQDDYKADYKYSQFEVKPIFTSSEDDDSRPTIIKEHTHSPIFISVLSGKISSIYDLDSICDQI